MSENGDSAAEEMTGPVPPNQPDRFAEPVGDEQPPRLPFVVVGLGASAGGLEAFGEFFDHMRPDSGMAFVLIQHLPPERESMLADILSKRTQMPVMQVKDGLAVKPNHVYVIRPGHTLTIKGGKLRLGAPVEKRGHQRPVDDFFRSLAAEQRERGICVVMSGMGSNGTAGARTVKAVGGLCIAQEPESAKFPSMPANLIEGGLADFILPPQEIPQVLLRYAAHPYARGESPVEDLAQAEQKSLREVLAIMRTRTNHDFEGYRKPTLVRRIYRRMGLAQLTEMNVYARTLRQNPTEVAALADDLMIHVTGFFRDAEAWEALRKQVIVPLVESRENEGAIRAWVTACSSGEEAYTLAMLIVEAAEVVGKRFDVKIFATDTAERSLSAARSGIFAGGIESEISPARLERFFDKDDSCYRVKKELRELVIVAPQNILRDPPFSRLDICTCRNLLIYLEPPAQRRVLGLLHFGLSNGGALLLGSSETAPSGDGMFEPIDKKHRLYRRVGPTRHGSIEFPIPRGLITAGDLDRDIRVAPRASVAQVATRALLDRFTPPSIVIDHQHHIVYFHGRTERYLDEPRGEPTRELMALLREPVRAAVRLALKHSAGKSEPVSVRDGMVDTPGGARRVEITVAPLDPVRAASHQIIVFNEIADASTLEVPVTEVVGTRHELEVDLVRVREELQGTIEELQTSNEEMKASNEEVTSINEELQSTNEELETSKEELQSLNEELSTVNSQLQAKMEELERVTNDLSSLLSSTDIAVLFLDMNLRIRRFTPAARDLIELIPTDIGRPLNDLARKFEDDDLARDVHSVLENLIPIDKEIRSNSGRDYIRRVLPYRTGDHRIEGVVITFVDITRRKSAEVALRNSAERHRLILGSIKEYAIMMMDVEGRFTEWTAGAEQVLGYTADEAAGKHWSIVFTPEDRAAGAPERKLQTAGNSGGDTEERWCMRKDGSRFWCSGTLSAMQDGQGKLIGFVKVIRDNTERRRAEMDLRNAKAAAESANQAKDRFLASVSHELRTPLSAILLWAQMLEQGKDVTPERFREGLEAIRRSAEAQKELIEDLLDTSRIAAGMMRVELSETDLVPLIESAVDAVRPAAQAKRLRLTLTLDPEAGCVRVDPLRIRQIVWNLLTNALKFTPAEGKISVQLSRNSDEVELQVSDSGRGISKKNLARIFDAFAQAEPASESKGGLGLGLAISKQLAELHGGSISASSEGDGKGAVFIVKLPLPRINPTAK